MCKSGFPIFCFHSLSERDGGAADVVGIVFRSCDQQDRGSEIPLPFDVSMILLTVIESRRTYMLIQCALDVPLVSVVLGLFRR